MGQAEGRRRRLVAAVPTCPWLHGPVGLMVGVRKQVGDKISVAKWAGEEQFERPGNLGMASAPRRLERGIVSRSGVGRAGETD